MATLDAPADAPSAPVGTGAQRRGVLALVLVAVLGLLLALGETVIVGRAESRIATEVGAQLGAPVEVDITSRPAAFAVLGGQIDTLSLTATAVPLEGHPVVIERLEVEATGIAFDGDVVTEAAQRRLQPGRAQGVRPHEASALRAAVIHRGADKPDCTH